MTVQLAPMNVLRAYAIGVFPMWDPDDDTIRWYRPDPRAILPLDGFHVSRSLARTLRRARFTVTYDVAFEQVMRACADRPEGTWISEEFVAVYGALHRHGFGHSVETWTGERLVGGTYGIALGAAFMAESMFHRETDASKVALVGLVERLRTKGFTLLDVQYITPHLRSLGAVEVSGCEYAERLQAALALDPKW